MLSSRARSPLADSHRYPYVLRLITAVLLFTLAGGIAAAQRGSLPATDPARNTVAWAGDLPAWQPAAPLREARTVGPVSRSGRVSTPPGTRWLPTGTGMWIRKWENAEGGNPHAVVARAVRSGLSHIYVRTGTRAGGFDGGPMLRALLPATRGTDLKVVAWDFPYLFNPVADARRLARAAWYVAPGEDTPRVAAVAPDIETPDEGTSLRGPAIELYFRELRRRLPPNVAILATVPWPSELRRRFPYGQVARHSDALLPMAYWINRDPGIVTTQSIQRLRRFGLPVMPIGQAYDPRLDIPTLKLRAPSGAQVDLFLTTARNLGAQAVSLWSWETASRDHWLTLKYGGRYFRPAPARPEQSRRPVTAAA